MAMFAGGVLIAAAGWQTRAAERQQSRVVDDRALKGAAANGDEWLTTGRDYAEQRYSPLTQIDASNVSRLGLAWSYEIGTGGGPQEATPLFANGVLYGITNWSIVFAVDARTGKELWRYDPKVDRSIDEPGSDRLCCGVISRGVALYQGKVIVPVVDGRLQALDAATGNLLWSVLAIPAGSVSYTITMAPRVANGKIFIGNAGGEFPPYRGYLSAFDVNNGKELWRFYVVPGDPSKPFENDAMKKAAKTWTGDWWKLGGGGSIWDGMAYDPDANLIYVGTGNGTPWAQDVRQGKGSERLDNLYIASILAIDANNGQLKWHFQCTPGDQWDYDAVQHLMLANISIDGRERRVIMQANKNGHFYVLDRRTGEFISAAPMAPVNWTRGLDPKTGRPDVHPDALYTAERGVTVSPLQSHNTSQMAFNPATRLVYVPIASGGGFSFTGDESLRAHAGTASVGTARPRRHGPAAADRGAAVARPRSAIADPESRHSLRVGSGDADGALVHDRRRPERRGRVLDRVESRRAGHAAGTHVRVHGGQGREVVGNRVGSDERDESADDLHARRQAVHRVHGRPRRHRRRVQSSTTAARRANRPRGCATATTVACADHNAGDAEVVRVHDRCEPLALVRSRAIT